MNTASIYDNNDGTVGLTSDYVEEFTAEMKQEVPTYARQWIKSDLSWVVDIEYYEILLQLCKKHFDIVELYNEHGELEFMFQEGHLVVENKKKRKKKK